MNHKQQIREHFINRAKQRLGVNLTLEGYNSFCNKINKRRGVKFLQYTDHDTQLLRVIDFGFQFDIVYNVKIGRPVTILPREIRFVG